MKKVLIFSHEYPPHLGGAGSVAQTLKYGLESKGYDVTVLTSSRSKSSPEKRVVSINYSKKFWPFAYAIWLIFNARKYDVIIANDSVAIYSVSRFLSKEIIEKTICFIHGEEKFILSKKTSLRLMNFKSLYKKTLFLSKKTIFVSRYIEKKYKDLYSIALDSSKRNVIHSGVKMKPKKRTLNLNFSEPKSFLTVSRIVQSKGFDTMLDVFIDLKKKGFDFYWCIAGSGEYLSDFKIRVKESCISENVSFLGQIDRSLLSDVYSSASYYISLSELNESYGLSFLEAASLGCIPIGYDRCGTKEAFEYIDGGLLVKSFLMPEKISSEILFFINNLSSFHQVGCNRKISDFIDAVCEEI